MKKIIFLISFCTVFINFTYGQNSFPDLSINKIENIKAYLSKFYQPDTSFVNHACLNTIVFVRFKIISNKIDSLSFSEKCPVAIKMELEKAILASNKFLRSSNDQSSQIEDKIYLLPVIFYYQIGCNVSQILTKSDDKAPKTFEYHNPDAEMHNSLPNMLKFENGKSYTKLDCILISPLTFFAYN